MYCLQQLTNIELVEFARDGICKIFKSRLNHWENYFFPTPAGIRTHTLSTAKNGYKLTRKHLWS